MESNQIGVRDFHFLTSMNRKLFLTFVGGLSNAHGGSATENAMSRPFLKCSECLEEKAPSESAVWAKMIWETEQHTAVC